MATYIGTVGNDYQIGNNYDYLYGADGDDNLAASAPGYDVVEGGRGWDYLYFSTANSTTYGSIYGGDGNDSIIGSLNGDFLYGGEGNDYILGSDFYFRIPGSTAPLPQDANDYIEGGSGSDAIFGKEGNDVIYGGDGDDSNNITINIPSPTYYSNNATVSSKAGLYGGAGDDYIDGGRGSDWLEGGTGTDNLNGGQGNDVLFGEADADALYGGEGNDNLYGGAGADVLSGGADYDYVSYETSTATVGVTARLDFNRGYFGEAEGDLIGDDVEGLIGTNFADTLIGNANANVLVGLGGRDILIGNAGNDSLVGGGGVDDLFGGAGADILLGQADSDNFYFNAADNVIGQFDRIEDFQDGLDRIFLQNWNPATLAAVEGSGNVYITTLDSNYSTGVIVVNATLAQVLDQVTLV